MKVYAFEFCSCHYESGWSVESIHESAKGARSAMKESRAKAEIEAARGGQRIPEWTHWRVRAITVKP